MAEVDVNIRGKGVDNLRRELEDLAQSTQSLRKEVEALNDLENQTPTQQRITIEQTNDTAYREKRKQIQQEYREMREFNKMDFDEDKANFRAGKMSAKDFKESERRYSEFLDENKNTEDQELKKLQKEQALNTRLMWREMQDKRKIEREEKQRDKSEFEESKGQGIIGRLMQENEELKKQRLTATTQEEVKEIDAKIKANKSTISGLEDDDEPSSTRRKSWASRLQGVSRFRQNLETGNVSGMADQGGGMIGKAGVAGMTAAAVIAAGIAVMNTTDKMYQSGQQLGSLRGRGKGSAQSMHTAIDESLEGWGGLGSDYGMSPEDIMRSAHGKALRTGYMGDDIMRRTTDDIAIQKGMGADVSGFDVFERFTTQLDESSNIALDILNVLNDIEESSLKEGDLVTFGEKMATMQTLMNIQRSKRDVVDTEQSLKVLAAFESVGLSQKGEKAGSFLQSVTQGLGEGGSDNAMLLKYEMAKQAHPELANDPLALRKFVKWHSDDPEYMAKSYEYIGKITPKGSMAEYDLLSGLFNPESEYDLGLHQSMINNPQARNILTSNKQLKGQRSGEMTMESAKQESKDMTSGMSVAKNFMGEIWKDFSINVNNMFSDYSGDGGKSLNVRMVNGKAGIPPPPVTPKGTEPRKGNG